MADCQELYNQFLSDAEALFDGMPNDLMRAAVADGEKGDDPFFMALGADDIDGEIRTYAAGGDMPPLSARQRWCLAVRMKLAAGVLYPFRHEQDAKGNALHALFEGLGNARIIELLLIDIVPSLRSVLSDYLRLGEEWHAPMRLPWHQSLLRPKPATRIET